MLRDWINKYLTVFVVLIAFVDGMLVAKTFMGEKSEVSTVDAVLLEDRFEPKTSTAPEVETPELLNVPFVSQAPYGLWTDPWAYMAEESTAYMAYLWVNAIEAGGREVSAQALLTAKEWEEANLETYKDTDLDQTLRLLQEFYGLQAQISYEVTREAMEAQLSAGNILILPVQNLENPHYGEPGPVFHMIVVYRIEGETFISNDPGTVRGAGYAYEIQKILESVQDLNGETRMIVVSR